MFEDYTAPIESSILIKLMKDVYSRYNYMDVDYNDVNYYIVTTKEQNKIN